MKITDEMVDAGIVGWHKAIIDAPDEAVPARRRRCIRAALEAALAAPASAEPVAWITPEMRDYLTGKMKRSGLFQMANTKAGDPHRECTVPLYAGPKVTPK